MPPPVDKLTPTDPRVQHRTYTIPHSNKTYHYLFADSPSQTPTATVLLVHGFPDLAFGWRYQVPFLLARNLRVIAPDLPGFGRSDAPPALGAYSFKAVVDDLAALLAHEGIVEKVVLGGHDWGGAVVWRFVLWRPELVRGVFSVCTPFWLPSEVYLSKKEVVRRLPNFGYQAQFDGTEVDEGVVGREKIRAFLSIMFGARRRDGQVVFDVAKGVRVDKLEPKEIGETPLLSREEMEFYVDEYVRNGIRGPLSWYKTGRVNYDEERKLIEDGKTRVTVPALMVVAKRDSALPPIMAAGMGQHCDSLVTKQVDATHWALWEAPAETNKHIGEFLDGLLGGAPLKASI